MTTELAPHRKSSLLDIELSWLPLVEARLEAEEIEDPEERARAIVDADVALANHASAEVQKVDGVIGFRNFMEGVLSNARTQAKRQQRRAQIAENVIKQLDASVIYAMQSVKRKRIDGESGALVVRGNGGVQPLVITDESMLPDEVCRMEGWMDGSVFLDLCDYLYETRGGAYLPLLRLIGFKRVPDTAAIRAKLMEPCPTCKGNGHTEHEVVLDDFRSDIEFRECETCGGSGKQGVPGARLADRGTHLEVR